MLNSLHISNLAVIREANADFSKGFTVLTGETGAGKSIFMSGIRILLGERADKDLVRNGASGAEVSAIFSEISPSALEALDALGITPDEEGMLMLSRNVSAEGKSTARINGRMVNLALLKEVSGKLIGIHGQNANRDLTADGAELRMLDSAALTEDEIGAYREEYRVYCELLAKIKQFTVDQKEKERMLDLLQYQIREIEAVSPEEGEDDALFEKKLRLKNSGKIQKQVQFAYRALRGAEKGNAAYILDRASAALSSVSDVLPEAEKIVAMLAECSDLVENAAEEVYALQGAEEEDPERALDEVETRLAAIEHLKRKYGATLAEVLSFYHEAKGKLTFYETAGEEQKRLKKQAEEQLCRVISAATTLRKQRITAAETISKQVTETLRFLDMPNALFEICVLPLEKNGTPAPDKNGIDSVCFMLRANVGEPSQPVATAASGGELARIMLAIRTHLCADQHIDVTVYDEIDAGVSGKNARKIGMLLKETAKEGQVFCITHSAQVASLADTHFLVAKEEVGDRVESKVSVLDYDGRVKELSRILGGIRVTEAQRMAAVDMLSGKD